MSGVYGWSYGSGGVHYYRVAEPLRVAEQHGIWTGTGNALSNDIVGNPADTILAHMLWDERASEGWQECSRSNAVRLVFDIDDVMWEPDWAPFSKHYTPAVLARVIDNIKAAHVVTTTTDYIADWVDQYHDNVWVVPNTVPEWLTRQVMPIPFSKYPSKIGHARYFLGYQGSPSHEHDVTPEFQQSLWHFIAQQQQWGIQFYGEHWLDAKQIKEYPYTKVRVHPWQPSVEKYLKGMSFDIGLGPLGDTPFNRGKSGLRAIEYSALGIPSVVSQSPAYEPYVLPGQTGLIVPQGEDWFPYLRFIAEEHDKRRDMGQLARECSKHWTTEANISKWVEAWGSA